MYKPISKRPRTRSEALLAKVLVAVLVAFIVSIALGLKWGIIPIAIAYELYKYHRNRQFPRGPKPGWRPLSARMGKEPLIPPKPTRWDRLRHRISSLARRGRRPRR